MTTSFGKRLDRDADLRDRRNAARNHGRQQALDEVRAGHERPWKFPIGSEEDVYGRVTRNKIFERAVGRPQHKTTMGVMMVVDAQLERDLVGQFIRAYHKQWGITAPTKAPEETWRRG